MPQAGDMYTVTIKPSHIDWGDYRQPTNRNFIEGESYVKIPSSKARQYGIVRGSIYTAYFTNGHASLKIKVAGNGPFENGVQYGKQFEGIGRGACKAFTPWYKSCNAKIGDEVQVEFISSSDIQFSILAKTDR